MGTVSVSDVSFDESESAVMTPAIKATHAVTTASTTLRVSQEGEEAVAHCRR